MQYKQWLECSGGTMFYFDKIFDLGSGMRIEIDNFNLISSTSATTVFLEFDSNDEEENYEYFGFEKGPNKNGVWVSDGPHHTDVIYIDNNTQYNVVITNNSLSINGVTKTYSRYWLADFNRLCINGSYDYENEEFYHNPSETKVRYGEIRYYKNNNLLVWLRPCVNNDTVCFFDFISKTYLTAFGGTPTAGPDYVRPVTGTTVPINKYKVGSTNIVKQQRGEDNVKKMYMGNDLVYQKFAFSPKLSISVDSMEFKCSGDTAQTVTVNSNTNWNYTTDVNWLTLTKDGNTLSVLPDDYTSELEDRTATITITADNGDIVKTKTISVTQKKVTTWEPVDYVYTSSEAYVDTTIRPTTNTKFTVKLKQTGRNGGATVGYFMSNTPITCENDDTDYRCFNYDRTNGFVWDFNSSRISGNISPESDGLIIATFGNNYIADKNGNKVATGSTQSTIATQRNVPIYINLDNTYAQIQQVTIYDNDVVVFDGYAADFDGDYGIYDTVSETLLKPTNGATVYKGTW